MANFCGGGFGSFVAGARNTNRGAHPISGSGGGRKEAETRSVLSQGVSSWGRQQLPSGQSTAVESQRKEKWNDEERRFGQAGSSSAATGGSTTIQDLSPHQANTRIAGIVVTKRSVRSFPDKRNPGCQRFNFNFTLRDAPSDYINVTCWSSEFNHITRLHKSFKICDIVEIVNGQILSKTGETDKFNPWTPSPYQINVSENYSLITSYSGPRYCELATLAHIPLRPMRDCRTLSSIMASGQNLDGTHVNILAAIRHVGKPQSFTSRGGKDLKKCEVKLMDENCPSFTLLIWEEEMIELAQTWRPKENILLAVDVKASFTTYQNCMTAVCDYKTLLITNPECSEAYQLFQYIQSVEITLEHEEEEELTHQEDIQFISEVYNIEEIKKKQVLLTVDGAKSIFTGILYAYLTHFHITGADNTIVSYKCTSCNFRVKLGMSCTNKNCPASSLINTIPASPYTSSTTTASDLAQRAESQFSLQVSFSDCTGEIENVWLEGKAASNLLGYEPVEFLNTTEEERLSIKQNLLLEKFKVYFKSVISQGGQRKKPTVKILSMSLADPREVAALLGVMC